VDAAGVVAPVPHPPSARSIVATIAPPPQLRARALTRTALASSTNRPSKWPPAGRGANLPPRSAWGLTPPPPGRHDPARAEPASGTIIDQAEGIDQAGELAGSLRMIRDSAAALVPRGDLRRVRALRFAVPGFDRAAWRQICGLGWAGLALPESAGGSGLGMRAFAALAEELGTGLVPEPLIAAAMGARVLAGPPLAALLAGESVIIPAWQERPNSLATDEETVLAGDRLTGRKLFIPMAGGADFFLVSARGGLAILARDAPGAMLALERTQDGGFFGTLTLDRASATPMPGDLSRALEEAALATAAYLLGVMGRAFAITLDYLCTRVQFGRPIGSFQALRHRAADLKIQLELSRASIGQAAATLDSGAPLPLCRAAVSRAKARASDAALLITRQAIQLHGGIGYTDEHDIGLFLRKAMVLANLYGSAALHRARYAALAAEDDDG
jgi:alkylation response protein AidB-like acyl-CoA dehydrogenase